MDRPKYLLLGDGDSPHMIKWAKELIRYFEVYLISLREIRQEISSLIEQDHLFFLNSRWNPRGGNMGYFIHLPQILLIIKKVKPTFVNAHYLTSYGLAAAVSRQLLSLKFFLIQSTWGTDILVTPLKNWFYSSSAKFSLNHAQLITSDSEFMSTRIHQLTSSPVLTFTFGLDRLPAYEKSLKQKGLFFSNRILSRNYNIDEVLHFFSRIAFYEKEARLVIANEGEMRNELESLARQLNIESQVLFCGFLSESDQEAWYQKAEFFFSIPTSDSTSVSLLEAMAHGCIPVVSDIPANHEWIIDESHGIIYSRDLDYETLRKFRQKEDDIITKNRKLISEKAIFPESIFNFSQFLFQQIKETI